MFFDGMPLQEHPWARPFGARWAGPPSFFWVEILKKFTGKNVPENYTLFFFGNCVFIIKTLVF